ncbi:MAG TPA: hypothetical protein VFT90_05265 [Chryseosolibacter sp.]|nr:hypothetical protein [Chryseosolibacter sp.]
MDSKSVTTLLIVIICILLFPVIIGIIGGVFGVIGGIIGAVFGAIGGALGAIFGVIGAIFGAIFGVIGWIFDRDFYWDEPFHNFGSDFATVLVLVIIVALVARSRSTKRVGK